MKLIASLFVVGAFFSVACGTSFTTSQDAGNDGAGDDDNASGGGATGGSTSSGGDTSTGGDSATGGDSSAGGSSSCQVGDDGCDAVVCDPALITCQPIIPPPDCPQGQVYSVKDGCHGECVDLDRCSCSDSMACPDPDQYVCHRYRGRCGPYVR